MTKYHVLQMDEQGHWEEITVVDSSGGESAAREGARTEGWHLAVPARSWNKVELEDDPTPRFRVKRSELPSAEDQEDGDDDIEDEDQDELTQQPGELIQQPEELTAPPEAGEDAEHRLEDLIERERAHGEAAGSR